MWSMIAAGAATASPAIAMSPMPVRALVHRGSWSRWGVSGWAAHGVAHGPSTCRAKSDFNEEEKGIFRVLDVGRPKEKASFEIRKFTRKQVKHRENEMPVDQDWEAVWPGPRTFHPSAVPLPVRQGFVQHKMGVRPPKRANIELMKTPNFLHLTPPVVKKQATTLKELCTPWPPGNCFKAFPVLSTTTDYLNTSSSIRDARARQVDFEVSVDALTPDPRIRENIRILLDIPPQRGAGATFKFLAANCPTRKQNLDHAEFLLTAIYFESRKNDVLDRDERQPLAGADLTGEAAHHVLTEGECRSTLADYKKSVLKAKLS